MLHLNRESIAASPESTVQGGTGHFQTTHWSIVLAAGQSELPAAREAIEKLCRAYWPALYAYIRRSGYPTAEAEDLTQEFFARLLDKQYLRGITREGGRFRSFLLTALKHFLVNEWRRSQRLKRGGGAHFLSWEELNVHAQSRFAPFEKATPEVLYERQWALMLLEQALVRLRKEYTAAGRGALMDALQIYLSGDGAAIPYAQIAEQIGLSLSAVKVAVHRMRRRYGGLVRQAVAETVSCPEEVEDEIRHLVAVLTT